MVVYFIYKNHSLAEISQAYASEGWDGYLNVSW